MSGGAATGAAVMVAVVLWSGYEFLIPEWYDWIFWAGVGMQPGALPVGIIAWAFDHGKDGISLERNFVNSFEFVNTFEDDDKDDVVVKEVEMAAADDVA